MQVNIPLLAKICEVPGTSGFENEVRKIVYEELKSEDLTIETDNLGNVYAIKKGKDSSKRVMIGAHMDEIGFIVKYIDDNGFIRFHTLGGFDPKTLTAQRVIVHGKKDLLGVMSSKPIHIMTPEERNKVAQISDYFIDLGMPADEVKALVQVGDPITRERTLVEMGNCVNCKSIDNRVAVYILIETLKALKDCPYDVYGVFTVQEEVGIRGANVAAHNINPTFGFGLDTTIAYDLPGARPEEQITKLGEGVAIKIMDASTICDYRMVRFQKQIAEEFQIKWQSELLPMGGTDTAGIQRMGKTGAIAGAISVPTRHLHQVIEMAHKEDISNSVLLLKHCCENLDRINLEF
ncbi:MAG TPA: M42 family metallopeptidase [Chitinophagales bacterium]|nr:M42 family metallopeptidase [Chitinophagales bacterium]HMV03702.1 M42 family metallopeptidase [Chitinophagales bacterium]HMW94070.1 M42 family metallopeptidase [Chitinophagales bacterium]HMY42054.1 M42 family metallopeptidase [Chitinophagales bacterium]HMZ67969.1 M42 family metallopeptidase [Chitinophagales bacterium]